MVHYNGTWELSYIGIHTTNLQLELKHMGIPVQVTDICVGAHMPIRQLPSTHTEGLLTYIYGTSQQTTLGSWELIIVLYKGSPFKSERQLYLASCHC